MESIRLFKDLTEEVTIKAPYVFSLKEKTYVPSKKSVTAATISVDGTVTEGKDETVQPNNEIWYTTTDGNIYELYDASSEGVTYVINLLSNTYEDGIGKMVFDGDVTQLSFNEIDEETGMAIDVYPLFASFDGGSTLETVQLPSSVTSIGGSAFYGCESLTSITIPSSVTSIGYGAFELSEITYLGTKEQWNNIEKSEEWNTVSCCLVHCIDGDIYNDEVTTFIYEDGERVCIYDSVLSNVNTSGLISVIIGNGVTSIGQRAFYRCESLTNVTFAEGSQLSTIGRAAFAGCTSLTSVTIPSSVTRISGQAFCDCTSLSAMIYNGITYTNQDAFKTALTDNGVYCDYMFDCEE